MRGCDGLDERDGKFWEQEEDVGQREEVGAGERRRVGKKGWRKRDEKGE